MIVGAYCIRPQSYGLQIRLNKDTRITNPREQKSEQKSEQERELGQEIQFFVDYTVMDYKLVDYEDYKIGCSFDIEFQDVFGDKLDRIGALSGLRHYYFSVCVRGIYGRPVH